MWNGQTTKVIKTTSITIFVTAILTLLGIIGSSGLRSMVQDEAKEAVSDSVKENKRSINGLEKRVEINEKEDNVKHAKIDQVFAEIENLKKNQDETNKRAERLEKKLDELMARVYEYMKDNKD